MKYLCLIYDEERKLAAMSESEGKAFMGEYFSFTNDLIAAGKMIVGEELKPTHTATTVRIRKGVLSTTPGGHLKFPHLWPGQTPPADVRGTR